MQRAARSLILIILGTLVLLLILFGIFYSRYVPTLCQMAETQAKSAAQSLIEKSVGTQIQNGTIRYDRIILFEKDVEGHIAALKTNMQEVNRLKSAILQQINQEILSMDASEIGIPLGSLLLPELCSGAGPRIPIHILSVRSSNAAFTSRFSQAGINQTLHQLYLTAEVQGSVWVLGEIRSFSVSSSILAAETVIVGQVPNSFS